MLDIGWSEMMLIAVVAIVVIGPKELPRALRTIGQWVGKARAMTRDFQSSVNDMIAESELEELRRSANSIGDFNANNLLDDTSPSNLNATTPPPPTPQKWPADDDPADDFDASDEELAEWRPDIVEENEDGGARTETKAETKVTDG
ncbi:MAG: Sec-independent protein translocase protein TatB [Alphaproteobacteria bacterium]|jgi:sec-independent protein translocase protein TatB